MNWELLGVLAVMMSPMIFGGLTMYYSIVTIEKETEKRWEKHE